MKKIDLKSLTYEEMETLILDLGEKKFRAKQIFVWIHNKLVDDIEPMNISNDLKAKLMDIAYISKVQMVKEFQSEIDSTKKCLFKFDDELCESVFMEYNHGNSVCISSQVGCRMKCSFCASTINGLDRNLSAGEMVSQVYELQKKYGKVSNIVVMGSGEPFDNFDNLIKFIEIINHKDGLNIGQRHITVSTCGIVPKIYELAELKLQINLAISLHAYNDDTRSNLMPINNKYDIASLIKAAKDYSKATGRRVTYEYALIRGVNDSHKDANKLGGLLRRSLCHVNLIPINNVAENNFVKSDSKTTKDFQNILKSMGIETTIRRELGKDIDASCGQLRNQYKEAEEDEGLWQNS